MIRAKIDSYLILNLIPLLSPPTPAAMAEAVWAMCLPMAFADAFGLILFRHILRGRGRFLMEHESISGSERRETSRKRREKDEDMEKAQMVAANGRGWTPRRRPGETPVHPRFFPFYSRQKTASMTSLW